VGNLGPGVRLPRTLRTLAHEAGDKDGPDPTGPASDNAYSWTAWWSPAMPHPRQ
jgi:hypothetical protein